MGLGDLTAGMRLVGFVGADAVEVLAVNPVGGEAVEVVYRERSGSIDACMATAEDLRSVRVERGDDGTAPYDADPRDFMLAAEALRIKYAALYDPMAAVSSSEIEPLPHQIRAVYEQMLPQVPLRFLLADDPGAGKTIMAGLYLKEMMLRSDCERALIVAPGGLVDQWHDELHTKFGLSFEVLTASMADAAQGNVFEEHPRLIVRMDQVSRSDALMDQLRAVRWDVAVVDEAHRMSAHYTSWNAEVKTTKRFMLGRALSHQAQHLLLMTATPHAGKEEDFQLFLTLLDADRFERRFSRDRHSTDTRGLMRRMVKEDLLTFEGRPLFPERRAYTVGYALSGPEQELYDRVTEYVRTEMGRADRIGEQGQSRRSNSVGFALTVLQRRLASSPEAITRSLERRAERLGQRLRDIGQRRAEFQGSRVFGLPFDHAVVAEDQADATLEDLDDFDDAEGDMSEAERALVLDVFSEMNVFLYAYALLHQTECQEHYQDGLKKVLPCVPKFYIYVSAGCELVDLYVNYECVEPYSSVWEEAGLHVPVDSWERHRIGERITPFPMLSRRNGDFARMKYGDYVTLSCILSEAYDYSTSGRSSFVWIIDHCRVKTGKVLANVNDPNDFLHEQGIANAVVALMKCLVTASMSMQERLSVLPIFDILEGTEQ